MDIAQDLQSLSEIPQIKGNGEFKFIERILPSPANYKIPKDPFYQQLTSLLYPKGLYSHQLDAISKVEDGYNVVIATSTASGKSLCYQLPIAKAMLTSRKRSHRPKALIIHPTKALAQDQLKSWSKLKLPGILVSTFDGDSTSEERQATKRFADVWLTNPEMVNSTILANHGNYHELLSGLEFIVLDEAHTYKGVFGSHVANVLRRLIRVARIYGSKPRFIFTSATIADPAATCSALINQDVTSVADDGSPSSAKTIAIWNPKMIDPLHGTRASYSRACALFSANLASNNHNVIAFVRSRKQSEVVANQVRNFLRSSNEYEVMSYRGGYLPSQRREIEELVTTGKTKVLVSTSAMELGIDIGHLDSAVIVGFPGTFSSFRQQIGRVGRGEKESAVILVCSPDALDQWIANNPVSIVERESERCVINPLNPFILKSHLRAACFESAISTNELTYFAPSESTQVVQNSLNELVSQGEISYKSGKYVTNSSHAPHRDISMRNSSDRQVMISTVDGELIGTTDHARAASTLHQDSIYIHLGQSFKVSELDLDRDFAIVELYPGDEQTRTIFDTEYENATPEKKLSRGGISLCQGQSRITQSILGFQTLSRRGEVLSTKTLDLPPSILDTRAFWLEFNFSAISEIPISELPGALHGAEHALISMMPIFTICDRSDIGGVSKLLTQDPSISTSSDQFVATITIYDGYPGGIGIAEQGFDMANNLIRQTINSVKSCACKSGCPSCIQSPKCGNLNSPLDKAGSIQLLEATLERLFIEKPNNTNT